MAGVILPNAPAQYSKDDQANMRGAIQEDSLNSFKRNEEVEPVRFVLKDTVTSTRYLITVASGALVLTAL